MFKIKNILNDKLLISYELMRIEDCAPAISEVTMSFNIVFENKNHLKIFTLRLIYQNTEGSPLVRGEAMGQWKFIDSFFHQLEYLY